MYGRPIYGRPRRDVQTWASKRGRPNDDRWRSENDEYENKYGINNTKQIASIFDMIGWFKTMTTNEYIRNVKNKQWPRFEKRLWQLRYWDHIIRNDDDYQRISNYINDNSLKWLSDTLKPS